MTLLCEYHYVFALEDGELGETDLLQCEIDTGNDLPNHQDATKDTLFSKGGGSKETEEDARESSNPALNHPGQAQ